MSYLLIPLFNVSGREFATQARSNSSASCKLCDMTIGTHTHTSKSYDHGMECCMPCLICDMPGQAMPCFPLLNEQMKPSPWSPHHRSQSIAILHSSASALSIYRWTSFGLLKKNCSSLFSFFSKWQNSESLGLRQLSGTYYRDGCKFCSCLLAGVRSWEIFLGG